MDTFQAHYEDIRDPGQAEAVAARLRADGLVTFDGISSRYELPALAGVFMTTRLHRDSGPDGVTVITDTGSRSPGYAAFTDRELTPHTDGAAQADPPGLLLLACLQPGRIGGSTIAAEFSARQRQKLPGQTHLARDTGWGNSRCIPTGLTSAARPTSSCSLPAVRAGQARSCGHPAAPRRRRARQTRLSGTVCSSFRTGATVSTRPPCRAASGIDMTLAA